MGRIRLHPAPVTVAAMPGPVRYTSAATATPPAGPTLGMMDARQYARYEELLRERREAGERLTLRSMRQCYELAMEDSEK